MTTLKLLIALSLIFVSFGTSVSAEERPTVIEFDGALSLAFPHDDTLEIEEYGTIEFWVEPGWSGAQDYDPVILSSIGDEGLRYAIVMSEEKDAIGLFSGTEWDLTTFDFNDGKLRHVAFIIMGDFTKVFVDGEYVDTLAQGIADVTPTQFHIASIDGVNSRFTGRLGGIRIWDTDLPEESIIAFKDIKLLSKDGVKHPDLDELIGVSEFSDKDQEFVLMTYLSPPLDATAAETDWEADFAQLEAESSAESSGE